jgi:serine/threonine protein kinase
MTSNTDGILKGSSEPVRGYLLAARYEIVEPIASGGMSTVYMGFDHRLNRQVAIKIMSGRLTSDPAFVQRFRREARAMAALNHPGLVSVHDHGHDRGHVFLVMELVEGGTLRDVLRRGPLTLPEVFTLFDAVLQPLEHAHRSGLIHRDIKPENILVSTGGVVKLTDFGLVRTAFTQTLMTGDLLLGTVPYMAPEQIAAGTADTRTDVYAAGIVAFEMLTGHPPFSADNPMSVAYQHVHSDVPSVSSRRPDTPPAVDDLVRAATRREPDDRPADAAALRALVLDTGRALDLTPARIVGPAPVRTRARTGPARVLSPSGTRQAAVAGPMTAHQPPATPTKPHSPAAESSADRPRPRSRRRRNTVLGLVTAVALALISAGSVYAVGRQSPVGGAQSANSGTAPPTVTTRTTAVETTKPATTVTTTAAAPPRTTTVRPPGTSKSVAAAPQAAPTSTTTPPPDVDWADGPSPNIVRTGTPPQFPESLEGWRLQNQWDVTPRAFDTDWTDLPGADYTDFPSTMNGCDNQRFLVRWRVLDEEATITAIWADDANTEHERVLGSAGWFDLDGCEHPAIHLAQGANGSTLSDVAVSVQQYWPAV